MIAAGFGFRPETTPFDRLPAECRVRAYGVEYALVPMEDGGVLYLTRLGWPHLENCLPGQWFERRKYRRAGERLVGGTGSVFRVTTHSLNGLPLDFVIKFSRFGTHVPLDIPEFFPDDISLEEKGGAHFNDPFAEFGFVMELRAGYYGPSDLVIRTKRPMAIYEPPGKVPAWRSGKESGTFFFYRSNFERDQKGNLDGVANLNLDFDRDYILLYGWVKGKDAEECLTEGQLDEEEVRELMRRVIYELSLKGFRVLDNKPKHVILRWDPEKGFLCDRRGLLFYVLIDFELLVRTEAYLSYLHDCYHWHS